MWQVKVRKTYKAYRHVSFIDGFRKMKNLFLDFPALELNNTSCCNPTGPDGSFRPSNNPGFNPGGPDCTGNRRNSRRCQNRPTGGQVVGQGGGGEWQLSLFLSPAAISAAGGGLNTK